MTPSTHAALPRAAETAFYAAVWELTRQIPVGKVFPYGKIAAYIPCPPGVSPDLYRVHRARWAGQAMAVCPDDVPWHRVPAADGRLIIVGKSSEEQRRRLEAEGIAFDARGRVKMSLHLWEGPDPRWLEEHGFLRAPDQR